MNDVKAMGREKKEDINILVVGDWIIDEDWVMMPERSETSAKLSDEKHFHTAFDDARVATKSLCGASLTASAIRGFLKSREKQKPGVNYNVFGIGVWHPDDNDYIEKLFKAEALNGINPFRISTPNESPIDPEKKNLFNLAREKDICATTRMVRTFLGHPGTLPRAMCRYDWHLNWQPSENGQNNKKKIIAQRVKDCFTDIAIKQVKIDAIVLSDFDKGLINDDLVEALIENIQPLKSENGLLWFHRSKQLKKPGWFSSLERKFDDNDRFIQFIDPRISRKSAEGKILLCGSGITWDGLEFIRNNKPDVPKSKLAVLFNDNNCIAYDGETDDADLWVINTSEKPAYFTRGRSSIFLASLLILELGKKQSGLLGFEKDYSFGENCSIALDNGLNWCNDCLSIWEKGQKVMQVSADINNAIKLTSLSSTIKAPKPLKWSVEDSNWSQAKNKDNTCCISSQQGDLRLEVWRAHTVLNEYTIIDDNRKQTTLNLVNTIQAFLDQEEKDRRRPLISLVKASPGSGKTFLAKCMANHFGFELLECNIAQLTGLDGLIHFFDQVDTSQRDGRKTFIFLDEVDSLVNGISAFSFLLELMWCGQYYRNGLKNTLKPFPGIFAMSRDPNKDEFKKDHPKNVDFFSRIYGINCELKDFTPEESIYLFAKLLDKYFGQIAYIEKRVLKTIGNTKLGYGPRSLELLISLLRGIRRDRVTMENLPTKSRIDELKEHFPGNLKTPGEMNNDDKKMVRIIYTNPL
ncbi:MAG: ATP-binding protein [Acidobacteriota bacterium]|nr:ATP-binding protein [Acidobacteriota bacterium]